MPALPIGAGRFGRGRFGSAAWQRDEGGAFAMAALVWVLLLLMLLPEGLDYRQLSLRHADSGTALSHAATGGLPISSLLWLGLLMASTTVVLQRGALAWALLRQVNPFWTGLIALALLSLLWSIDPVLSTRRLLRLVTIAQVCLAFQLVAWQPQRLQQVLRPLLSAVLAASLLFGLVAPEWAIHQELAPELAGAWRGLASHKNGLGALASLALILWAHAGLVGEVRASRAWAGVALALTALLLSRSSTSLAAALAVVAGLLWVRGVAWHAPQRLAPAVWLALGGLLLFALAILNLIPGLSLLLAPITSLTDKDASLTGRTQIWAIVSEHIARAPLFGSGYAAYWTPTPELDGDAHAFITRMGGFFPGSSHNGYLEVANDLGWVGLAALVGYLVVTARQSLQVWRDDRLRAAPLLWLALLAQQMITNCSESHWFDVRSVDFVLMALVTTSAARQLLERQLRATHGSPD